MIETPDHEQLRGELPAAALEILDAEELQRVLVHVKDCPECARRLEEYRETAARLALELPPRGMDRDRSRAVRARLLSRVAREGALRKQSSQWSALVQWTGWLVAAGIAGVLLVHHSIHRPVDYGWLVAGALLVVLVVLSFYLRAQRRRASVLKERLERLERQGTVRDREIDP